MLLRLDWRLTQERRLRQVNRSTFGRKKVPAGSPTSTPLAAYRSSNAAVEGAFLMSLRSLDYRRCFRPVLPSGSSGSNESVLTRDFSEIPAATPDPYFFELKFKI